MAANRNFTVKLDLRDANIIADTMRARIKQLMEALAPESVGDYSPDEITALRARVMDLERLLRVDFDGMEPILS